MKILFIFMFMLFTFSYADDYSIFNRNDPDPLNETIVRKKIPYNLTFEQEKQLVLEMILWQKNNFPIIYKCIDELSPININEHEQEYMMGHDINDCYQKQYNSLSKSPNSNFFNSRH